MNSHSALVWRSPAARGLLALVPAWLTLAVLIFGAPMSMKLAVGAAAALSLLSPYRGLIAVAAFVPLADFAGILLNLGSYRLGEAVTVAFLAGWLLRGEEDRPGPSAPAPGGWLIAAVVAASMLITAWRSEGALPSSLEWMFYGYYLSPYPTGWADGARILEGVALVAAVVTIFRRRPRLAVTLPAALAAAGALAGVTNVLLWYGVAPLVVLKRHALIGYRFTAHVGDVNAAGSYFALTLCVALGMALRSRGTPRLYWLAAAGLCGIGAWLALSRTANAAALIAIVIAAAWWFVADRPRKSKLMLAAACAVGIIAAAGYQVRELARDRDYRSADFRRQFNAASMRMVASAPWSGVGIGQYPQASMLFLGSPVAYSYGTENAHNYFLQLAAELGLVGFAAIGVFIAAALVHAVRAIAIAPRDARLLGLTAGVAAFLTTWVTGHPLLLTEIAVPFWLAFGLLTALARSTLYERRAERRDSRATLVAVAAVVAGVIAQLAAANTQLRPSESQAVTGLFEWETGADGRRYRWMGEYASVFVPADVTRVYVPVRLPAVAPTISPMSVEARTEGKPGTRVRVGDGWAVINLELPDALPYARYKRINLRAERTWRPALYQAGSRDMRDVGVQVGELRLFRD